MMEAPLRGNYNVYLSHRLLSWLCRHIQVTLVLKSLWGLLRANRARLQRRQQRLERTRTTSWIGSGWWKLVVTCCTYYSYEDIWTQYTVAVSISCVRELWSQIKEVLEKEVLWYLCFPDVLYLVWLPDYCPSLQAVMERIPTSAQWKLTEHEFAETEKRTLHITSFLGS